VPKLGVEAVEAFSRKCEDTGIDRGIIVSAKGFTKTAVRKAEFHNIGCLALAEVNGFDWCGTPGIECKLRNIDHTRLFVGFPEGTDLTQPVVMADGRAAGEEMGVWARNLITSNSDKVPFDIGEHQVKFIVPKPEIFIGAGDQRVQAVRVDFDIRYTVRVDLALFKFRRYSNTSTETAITETAIATVPIGQDRNADIVLSTGEEGISVVLVPQKTPVGRINRAKR